MTTLIIVEGIIFAAFVLVSIWWILEFKGLPSKVKCALGAHDVNVTRVEKHLGWGFFGGPVTTYYWTCRKCNKRGYT